MAGGEGRSGEHGRAGAMSSSGRESGGRHTFLVGRVGPSTRVVRRVERPDTDPAPWARAVVPPVQLQLRLGR